MSIHLTVKDRKRNTDYLFVEDVSVDCYESALFRLTFKYDTLKRDEVAVIKEQLQKMCENLLEILNGSDESSLHSGSHEDRIKSLEEEIATLTNDINMQSKKHGILKITPITDTVDFNKEGTMIKFTNADNGVYTTSILKNNTETEIVLPIGEYTVNLVNSLNDMVDSVFEELWENATSEDSNYTMKYTVVEDTIELETKIKYENGE